MSALLRLRAAWRLLRTVVHVVHGVWVILLHFPKLQPPERHERIRWWSLKTLRLLGITHEVRGVPVRAGGTLLVANHISWMDIMAVHAFAPHARFVSKADVREWPILNRLVDGADTLYIERERRRDAMRLVHQMAEVLSQGHTVAVFPEGTTGSGHDLLPFHANLLQAAIAAEAPIQPMALRYSDRHHAVSLAVDFLGETTLAQSVWRIACADDLRVSIEVLSPQGTRHADRRALAQHVRTEVAQALGISV